MFTPTRHQLIAGLKRLARCAPADEPHVVDISHPASRAGLDARALLADFDRAAANGDAQGLIFCEEDAEALLFPMGRETFGPIEPASCVICGEPLQPFAWGQSAHGTCSPDLR